MTPSAMKTQKGIYNCYKVLGFPHDPRLQKLIRRGPQLYVFSVATSLKPLSLKLCANSVILFRGSCSVQGKWIMSTVSEDKRCGRPWVSGGSGADKSP